MVRAQSRRRPIALQALLILSCAVFICAPSRSAAQTRPGSWVWMGGSNIGYTSYQNVSLIQGVCGTEYQFAPENVPGGNRQGDATWTDANGRLWLFGGNPLGCGSSGGGLFNDLWVFDPSQGAHGEWAWMGGSTTEDSGWGCANGPYDCGIRGVYGTEYQFSAGNAPGGREYPAHWTDKSGKFWMFGGWGFDSAGDLGYLDDLWVFDPTQGAHGEWAWMGGSSQFTDCGTTPGACDTPSVSGTEYQFDPANTPGGREYSTAWIDGSNRLWLFCGFSNNPATDLWVFDPAQGTHGEWAWMGGGAGQKGGWSVAEYKFAPGNLPAYRQEAVAWTDKNGNFWLFGGTHSNDLWVFNPTMGAHGEWAWMGGLKNWPGGVYSTPPTPNYGTEHEFSDGAMPGLHSSSAAWTDKNGWLWLFGGWGQDRSSFDWDLHATSGPLDDLWVFDPAKGAHGQWAWMGGHDDYLQTCDHGYCTAYPGIYGTEYLSSPGNLPGGREGSSAWADSNGNFWLWEGIGWDSTSTFGSLTDLWEFVPVPLDSQTVDFAALPSPVTYGSAPITLSATASSGLPVTFSILSGPAITSGTDGSTLTLTGGGFPVVVQAFQQGSTQYSPALVKRSFWAKDAPLTVQADNKTMPAGGAVPALTWTATGFLNGDTYANSATGAPALTTTATSASAPGTYPITITLGTFSSLKYVPTFLNGTLTILNAQTISFPALPQPLTYGAAPIALSATASSGLPVTYKLISGPGQLSGTNNSTLTITGAGAAVVVNAYQAGDSTYYAAPVAIQSRWIQKALLSVKADNHTITYGQAIPTLTWTPTGLVNGDTAATALTGSPSLTTTATSTSDPGTYPIQITTGTLAAANYLLSLKQGFLTIKPLGTLVKPTFTLPSGTYTGSRLIAINTANAGATIYYTTDGSTPSPTNGTRYTAPLTVPPSPTGAPETLKAIAVETGYTSSAVASVTYTFQ